jgi:hypothetical protein
LAATPKTIVKREKELTFPAGFGQNTRCDIAVDALEPEAYPAAEMLGDWGVLVLNLGDQTFGLLSVLVGKATHCLRHRQLG